MNPHQTRIPAHKLVTMTLQEYAERIGMRKLPVEDAREPVHEEPEPVQAAPEPVRRPPPPGPKPQLDIPYGERGRVQPIRRPERARREYGVNLDYLDYE